jgi:hypothetical protein
VGAYGYEGNKGAAFVLYYDGTNWDKIAKLFASDRATDDYFGYSVSISGNNIVIGAYNNDGNNDGNKTGSAYVFTKPSGEWIDTTETAKLTASDGATYDFFGCSVSISGDNILIGAKNNDDNGDGNRTGSVYVFTKPSGGWLNATETAKLTASDGDADDRFGVSVSISGDNIVIGAFYDDDNAGSAYLFRNCTETNSTISPIACGTYTSPSGKIWTTTGTYKDTIPNANLCDSVITINLTINNVNTTVTQNSATLTADETNATYQWIDCDNNNTIIAGETNQSFTATTNGNYAVIIDDGNCGDTSSCYNVTVSYINTISQNGISIYPNPAHNFVVIQNSEFKIQNLKVLDITGKYIYCHSEHSEKSIQINISDLKTGVYFIKLTTNNTSEVLRFVKK